VLCLWSSVGFDKFRKNVYISVGIFISIVLVDPITDRPMNTMYDRTFDVGIFPNLKLNACFA